MQLPESFSSDSSDGWESFKFRPSKSEPDRRNDLLIPGAIGVNTSSINVGDHYRAQRRLGFVNAQCSPDQTRIKALLSDLDRGLSIAFLPSEYAGPPHLTALLDSRWETHCFFDRKSNPVGGAIFLDRIALSSEEQPISLRYIGFLYVTPEVQGQGAGRTIVDVVCHLASPDIVLADVINPFSLCPNRNHPAHIHPDRTERDLIWRKEFGQIMDPYGRLAFWSKQGFMMPLLDKGESSEQFAPFPAIPLDCNPQPVVDGDSAHSYCCLVRPTSLHGQTLLAKGARAREWASLYRPLYPQDPVIDQTNLKAFERLLKGQERSLSLVDIPSTLRDGRLLMKLSRELGIDNG